MKTVLFQSCDHCWVFQICWHIGCSTFTASSFKIWNSSTGVPSPPLAQSSSLNTWSPSKHRSQPNPTTSQYNWMPWVPLPGWPPNLHPWWEWDVLSGMPRQKQKPRSWFIVSRTQRRTRLFCIQSQGPGMGVPKGCSKQAWKDPGCLRVMLLWVISGMPLCDARAWVPKQMPGAGRLNPTEQATIPECAQLILKAIPGSPWWLCG